MKVNFEYTFVNVSVNIFWKFKLVPAGATLPKQNMPLLKAKSYNAL